MKSKINIPKNTKLLRVASFNVNVSDNIDKDDISMMISMYIFSFIYGIDIDILCIQGINNMKFLELLLKEIYKTSVKMNIPIQISPNINFKEKQKSISSSIKLSLENIKESITSTNNIIISKYPIISERDIILKENDEELLVKTCGILANINIDGYIVSIYNLNLSEDYLGISNKNSRTRELESLLTHINENTTYIKKKFTNLINNNINIICGIFNIREVIDSNLNKEYIDIIKQFNAMDCYRCYNISKFSEEIGITNMDGFRDCYILLSFVNGDFVINYNNIKGLLKYIYVKYGISLIKSHILKNIKSKNYYAIETIFLMDKKEKSPLLE